MKIGMSNLLVRQQNPHKSEKLIVILGATTSGKTRLSLDLATRFSPSEIVNSDKQQFYRGLDVTTNKIPMEEQRGIPHHLIGEYDSVDGELTAADFRSVAALRVTDIWSRNSLPILVGGSNSYIHALLTKHFDSDSEGLDFESVVSPELRYNCCFLWVHASPPVHKQFISLRVQQMLDAGMLEELSNFFETEIESPSTGIKKSIGVGEFEKYFKVFPPGNTIVKNSALDGCQDTNGDKVPNGKLDTNGNKVPNGKHLEFDGVDKRPKGKYQESDDAAILRKTLLEEAIHSMKENAFELAKKQVEKIELLRSSGWNILKLDVTKVIQTALTAEPDSANASKIIWENEIVEPSIKIVKQFLEEQNK